MPFWTGSGGVPPAGAALVPDLHPVPAARQLHAAGAGGGLGPRLLPVSGDFVGPCERILVPRVQPDKCICAQRSIQRTAAAPCSMAPSALVQLFWCCGGPNPISVLQTLMDISDTLAAADSDPEASSDTAHVRLAAGEGSGAALLAAVHTGLCDDLNTPAALAAVSAPLKTANDLMQTKKGAQNRWPVGSSSGHRGGKPSR